MNATPRLLSVCALTVWAGLAVASGLVAQAAKADHSPWERAIVSIEASRKQYDYAQPWSRRMETTRKSGVVVAPRQILTTAEGLNDRTLVRVQKEGRGPWWNVQVEWIDYHANLALLNSNDPKLWAGLQPAPWAEPVPTKGPAELLRWRNGNLETVKGEINHLTVKKGKLTFVDLLHLEVRSEISAAGWAEAVVSGRKLLGLVASQEGNLCSVIPAPWIRAILEARKKGAYRGLGYFDFIWQKVENPATIKHLKLDGEPRGALVIGFLTESPKASVLKPRDLILQIEGFDIDSEGDYQDPTYGNLLLENLASRGKWAGDTVRLHVWRDGQPIELVYTLPKAEYTNELVPQEVFDQEPDYFLAGGLVFQPLVEPYLRLWGADWRRKAPFRLTYYPQEKPTPERRAWVILAMVLPDPYVLGYQDYRFLAVEQVNGKAIRQVADLAAAFQQPQDGYHVIEFAPGEAYRRVVLDATGLEAATRRVMQRYGIEQDHHFATQGK
jgi:hypothetical protein